MSGTEELKAQNVEEGKESIAKRKAEDIEALDKLHLDSIKLGEELIDEINNVMKENYEFLLEKKRELDEKRTTPEEAYKWANDYIKVVEDRAADGQRRIEINLKYLLDIQGTPGLIEDEMKEKKDKILEMQKEKEDLEEAIKRQENEIKEKEEYLRKLESDSNRKEWIEQRLQEIAEMEEAEKAILGEL